MVVSACTLHDPKGDWRRIIEQAPDINEFYDGLFAVATDVTAPKTVKILEARGWAVIVQKGREGLISIGDGRRLALEAGLETGQHIHFNDFDRLLYWVTHHPDELRSIVKEIPNHDFLILGRTQGALESHTRAQIETECLVNKVFSLIIGWYSDIVVGSRGVSERAARLILEHSIAEYCNTDAEWPLIVHHLSDMKIDYIEVDGMGYETLMRRPSVEIDGRVLPWKEYVDSNPGSWVHRINMAHKIAATAAETHEKLSKT